MTREKQDPIQEQLIQARRNQILDAATTVFAEKGFQRATIRDVAKAAGIADGTIYNYFENKTALMLGILDRLNQTEQRDEDIAQVEQMDLRAFVQSYLRQRFAFMTEEGLEVFQAVLGEVLVNAELRTQYMEQIIEPTYELSAKYFQRAVEEGRIRPMDVPLSLRVTSAMFLGLIVLRIMGDKEVSAKWDALPELLTTMLLDGISTE
jgi:TetR/AcrR family fatty acid metabolism transcriptional regulator